MAGKRINLGNLFISMSFLGMLACSMTPKERSLPKPEEVPEPVTKELEGGDSVVLPPRFEDAEPIEDQEPPPDLEVSEAQSFSFPRFGVWIDSWGLDSFVGLGFLQELESQGVQISKVIGTGMGCWTALAWAYEGSSSQAEWQAFKLDSWGQIGLDRSLFSRLSGDQDFSSFQKQFKRLFDKEEFNELTVDADCPYVDLSGREKILRSAKPLGLSRSLWIQSRIPGLKSYPVDAKNFSRDELSGHSIVLPGPEDLDAFAWSRGQDGEDDGDVEFWLVIKTSSIAQSYGFHPWAEVLAEQREAALSAFRESPKGSTSIVLNLAQGLKAKKQDLENMDQRRRFLLHGRKKAKEFLRTPWIENNFSSGFSAQPR